MRPDTRNWLDNLRAFAIDQRHTKPPVTAASPAEQAAERMILAAQLSTWLAGVEDIVAARRAWLDEADPEGDCDPAIVVTTSPVGIGVAEHLAQAGSLPARSLAQSLVAVTELEYRLWCMREPDDHGRLHVTVWNWIKSHVPPQRHAEFSRHPLAAGEAYWLHRAGIAKAGSADHRDCHLWKWNGHHASLLEAFVAERGLVELRGPAEG